MPESRGRKKKTPFVPTSGPNTPASGSGAPATNPAWFLPVMLGLMGLGLLWVVVYYLSQAQYPIPNVGNWNLAIGFAFIIAGFGMTTQWK